MNWRDREVSEGQRTHEWFQARVACLTASQAHLVLQRLKNGQRSQKAKDYITEIVAERLTGKVVEKYVSYFMDLGNEREPEARKAYEKQFQCMIQPVGFILHPNIKWFGASPDGVIDEEIGVEFKCPQSSTHVEYLTGQCEMIEGVPAEYISQCDAGMACLELDRWIFASYHPDMPKHLQFYSVDLRRNEKRIAELEYGVVEFLNEVDAVLEKLPKEAA